jgi:gluconolactonase
LAISDFTYPNGLAFSTDEKILYVNDTRGGNIRAFGMNPDGSVGPGRIFHTLTGDEDGVADRMKVGQNDSVYCTGPGGIHIINSSRDLIGRLLIPGHYANLAWGGINSTLSPNPLSAIAILTRAGFGKPSKS